MTEKDSISRLDVLEEKINRAAGLAEIRNLINRYLFYLENGDVKGIRRCPWNWGVENIREKRRLWIFMTRE